MAEEPVTGPQRPAASRPLAQAQQLTEETAQRLIGLIERSGPVQRLRASQLATALLASVGLALFIVGVERAAADIPIISNAYGSIGVGIVLLAISGVLLRRLTGHE